MPPPASRTGAVNRSCVAWVKDEIGRAVGLPSALGGIPLDEIGATGWGIRHAAEVVSLGLELQVLVRARVRMAGDERQAGLRHARPVAVQERVRRVEGVAAQRAESRIGWCIRAAPSASRSFI